MPKKNTKKKSLKTVQERAEAYLKNAEISLKHYSLSMRPIINFPRRRKAPLVSRIAIWIITKQGGVLDLHFLDNIKK